MTGRCENCRFWNRKGDPLEARGNESTDWEPRPTTKQKCLNVPHANDCRSGAELAFSAPAAVTDGSGYSAEFWTEPTFGCTSFEARVESEP